MALRHACRLPVGPPRAMCVALVACLALGIETVRPLSLLPADEVRLSIGRDVATRPGAQFAPAAFIATNHKMVQRHPPQTVACRHAPTWRQR
jgi:hypothetical protein